MRINRAEAVPKSAFRTRQPIAFQVGMALETVDKKNPSLIRPAIVTAVDDYFIKILFIGWPDEYAYWIRDDSCDIFPPGYAKKTNHPIECPLGKLLNIIDSIITDLIAFRFIFTFFQMKFTKFQFIHAVYVVAVVLAMVNIQIKFFIQPSMNVHIEKKIGTLIQY